MMMHVSAKHLIERRFALIHGAIPATQYPHFCVVETANGLGPSAALGFRMADVERLFLEDYLDAPIEEAVSGIFGFPVGRERIVEIGAHASIRSRATVELWVQTARHLDGIADVVVAVLTAPLRAMFDRLGIAIEEICDADPAKLPDGGEGWGRYYEQQPRVCAGLIAPAIPKLSAFDRSFGYRA